MVRKEVKKISKKEPAPEEKEAKKAERYVEGVGRRKTAVARVRIVGGQGKATVNDRDLKGYFGLPRLEESALAPVSKLKLVEKFDVHVKVRGGVIKALSEAIRLGLARALSIKNPDLKKRLRTLGFLTRDPRMVERKKYGLKKARRAPQWQKR